MATMSTDSICRVHSTQPKDQQHRNVLLTDRDILGIVERKLRVKDFRVIDWCMSRMDGTMGYLGQYYSLKIMVRVDEVTRTLKFFAKAQPHRSSPQYEFLQQYDAFNKEIVFYMDVVKRMGRGSGPRWLVECYLGKKDTIIVLEDARLDGYVTLDKHVPLSESYLIWCARTFARFHSRSLIFEERLRRSGDSRTIQDFYGHLLVDVLYGTGQRCENILRSALIGACALVDLMVTLNKDEKKLVKLKVHEWSKALKRLLEPSRTERNVICHRDVWTNNMMFKSDANGEPVGCYLVDFQFVTYSPPALDLALCLYSTTDKATRDRVRDPLARIYHDTVKVAFEEEGLNVEDCLSWEKFNESFRRQRQVALMYALMSLQVTLMSSETAMLFAEQPDRMEEELYGDKRDEYVIRECRMLEPYRLRLTEVLLEIKDYLPDKPPNY